MRDVPPGVPAAGWPWEVAPSWTTSRRGPSGRPASSQRAGPRRDRVAVVTVLAWLRDLGARWAAPRPDRPKPPRSSEIARTPDPRAALARRPGAQGRRDLHLLARQGRASPGVADAGDAQGRLDCSRFASWCLGLDRKSDAIDGGWISTDSIVRDATGKRRLFRVVPAGQIRAGDPWCSRAATSRAGASRSATSAWSPRPGRRSRRAACALPQAERSQPDDQRPRWSDVAASVAVRPVAWG